MTNGSTKAYAIFYAQITLALAAFFIAFGSTLLTLHERWSYWTASYSHGYLLVATAIYLYIESSNAPPRWLPDLRNTALIALALSSLGWLIFYLAGITVLQQLILPIIFLAMLGSLVDKDRFWRAILPVTTVYLAIPIWDDLLIGGLQLLSTKVSGWLVVHVFGIPATISGFDVSIPAGTIKIETGCSGLVYFLSALTLGIVYGQLFFTRLSARIGTVIVAGMLGILVNWIRISSLIVIGQVTNMQSSLLTEGHLLFGWYLFSGTMLIAALLASRLPVQQTERPRKILPPQIDVITLGRLLSTLAATILGSLLLLTFRYHSLSHTSATARPPASLSPMLIRTDTRLSGFVKPGFNATYRYLLAPDLTVSIVFYPTFFGEGKLVDQIPI